MCIYVFTQVGKSIKGDYIICILHLEYGKNGDWEKEYVVWNTDFTFF